MRVWFTLSYVAKLMFAGFMLGLFLGLALAG